MLSPCSMHAWPVNFVRQHTVQDCLKLDGSLIGFKQQEDVLLGLARRQAGVQMQMLDDDGWSSTVGIAILSVHCVCFSLALRLSNQLSSQLYACDSTHVCVWVRAPTRADTNLLTDFGQPGSRANDVCTSPGPA
jgi:hypothetical protein